MSYRIKFNHHVTLILVCHFGADFAHYENSSSGVVVQNEDRCK